MTLNKAELIEKSNRIQIAVSEINAKTVRKMCAQKPKNVIRNVKGKKSLSGNAAVTLSLVTGLKYINKELIRKESNTKKCSS